jgi:pimeloyl-ACP methyl ester carboxylesterase
MTPDKKSFRRKAASILFILLACVFFTVTSQSVIHAESFAEQSASPGQAEPIRPSKMTVSNPSALMLDFTSVATVYLPIIYRFPSSVSECSPTAGSGGLPPGRYETTIAGLNASVVVGTGYDPHTPTYLGFFIHGDGGNYTRFQKASNPVTQFVNQQGWVFVAPQSPNGGESWWTHWNGDHNQAFARVLDEMFAKYNVCRNIVFGSSGSGGSVFWTAYFFPEKGGEYPAHTIIGCGGTAGRNSTSRQQIIALGQNPTVVARSSFEYVYGTEDYLYDATIASIEFYTQAGFHVYPDELQGAGHCNEWTGQGLPSLSEQTATRWANRAAELGVTH